MTATCSIFLMFIYFAYIKVFVYFQCYTVPNPIRLSYISHIKTATILSFTLLPVFDTSDWRRASSCPSIIARMHLIPCFRCSIKPIPNPRDINYRNK